jgi:hypothetical protein
MLDTGCWITAVFYLFFIQLNYVENNDHYLKKLGNEAVCGFSFASIKHPESSIMNVQFSHDPASHKGSP